MRHRVRWFMIAFSMVLALAPFASVAAAAMLASALGCKINDAATEPCHAFGIDFGPVLAALVPTEDLGEITFSILAMMLLLWAAFEGLAFLVRWWRGRAASREEGRKIVL